MFTSELHTEVSVNNATTGLTLLLVEDDILSREMALLRLRSLFKHVVVAGDGIEGLRLFLEYAPDIVLSDQIMPGLSGLEMMHQIRSIDQKTPLILMTYSIDNNTLLDAINLGINRFIPKPFDYNVLVRVLNDIIRELLDKQKLEQCQQQEMELLRYRDNYNSIQQEAARRKERHVARHDLRNQVITGAGGIRWGINVTNSSKDIMCGDGYTIRNLPDGRQLIFVVDGMGSGLSASISALLATSFCNYLVKHLHQSHNFNMKLFLKHFQEYLGDILLDEEALSCGFLLVDLMSQNLETAIFGLPPLLMRKLDGSVCRISGTNPPLSIYSNDGEIIYHSLAEVADIMIMTDGITDALLPEGSAYRERLMKDFQTSPTMATLLRSFRFHTVAKDQDDLTLLHLHRLDLPGLWNWSYKPILQMDHVGKTVNKFLHALDVKIILGHADRRELLTMLTEALTNALEHGCFEIDRREKVRLLHSGEFDSFLPQPVAASTAHFILSASLWQGAGRPLLFIEIHDNRPDLHKDHFLNIHKKSGLQKVLNHWDSFFVGGPGCRLLLVKTIGGGDEYAH